MAAAKAGYGRSSKHNMLKSCPTCGRLHPIGAICPKQSKRTRAKSESEAAVFRNTSYWRRIRETVRVRDRYLCRVCLDAGEWSPVKDRYIEVHHIVPLSEQIELCDEPTNLICLCKRHHEDAEAGLLDRVYLKRLTEKVVE